MGIANKKVLVTGAGGFIGSHLVEQLLGLNCEITAFLHYNSFNRAGWLDYLPSKITSQIHFFFGDIRDPNGVREAMKGQQIVFHLAALIGIPYSYHSPDSYLDTNIKGTLNILQAARDLGVERIIHTSTSEVYGTAQFVPITEEHPINPQSPYAATKSAADFLALTFYKSFETPVVILRPFNTFGPRQSARAIVPTIIIQIIRGQREINLGSTRPTRDLNFVQDTAKGFILGAQADNVVGEVINLGSGIEISIGDLVNKIAELIGEKVRIITDEERMRPQKSEVERLLASPNKAQRMFGWKPEYPLDDGLKKTIKWFQNDKQDNLQDHLNKSGYII